MDIDLAKVAFTHCGVLVVNPFWHDCSTKAKRAEVLSAASRVLDKAKISYHFFPEYIERSGFCRLHFILWNVSSEVIHLNSFGYLDIPCLSSKFGHVLLNEVDSTKAVRLHLLRYLSTHVKKTGF